MATHIEVGLVGARSSSGEVQVEYAVPLWSAAVTPSATNMQATPVLGGVPGNLFVTIVPDVDVYVAFGDDSDATIEPRRKISAGMPRSFVYPGGRISYASA